MGVEEATGVYRGSEVQRAASPPEERATAGYVRGWVILLHRPQSTVVRTSTVLDVRGLNYVVYRHHNLSLPCVLHGGDEAQNALQTSRKCESPVPAQPNTRRSPSRKSRRARSLPVFGLKDALGPRSLVDAEADAPRATAEIRALDRCARTSADQKADEVFCAQSSKSVPGSYEAHGAAAMPILECANCMLGLHGLALHVVSGWQSTWPSSPSVGYLGVLTGPC